MHRIAIIPARSGSKGIKDKNIVELNGEPLIAYTIKAAIDSQCFDAVFVSSDSEKYLHIASTYGAKGSLRKPELSGDYVATFPVLEDFINGLDPIPDEFALLQATSPLRNAQHIREAVSLFEENKHKYDYVVSVCKASTPSVLIRELEKDGSMKKFDIDYSIYRRQDYHEYTPNGAIYVAKTKPYLEQKHFYGEKALAYEMSKRDSIDIDDEIDLHIAEYYLKSV